MGSLPCPIAPDGFQHLLSRGGWDVDAVRDGLRGFVIERLQDDEAVLVVDETVDLKKGTATVEVQRQYTGTAGRIENSQVAAASPTPPRTARRRSTGNCMFRAPGPMASRVDRASSALVRGRGPARMPPGIAAEKPPPPKPSTPIAANSSARSDRAAVNRANPPPTTTALPARRRGSAIRVRTRGVSLPATNPSTENGAVTPESETSSAMNFNYVVRSVGYSLGSAIGGLIVAAGTGPGHFFPDDSAHTTAALVGIGAMAIATLTSLALARRRSSETNP